MIIKVKNEHIEQSNGCQTGDNCPVSRAIFAATGKAVWVTRTDVWSVSPDGKHRGRNCLYPLPKSAMEAINDWDSGRGMKPFNFRLKVSA